MGMDSDQKTTIDIHEKSIDLLKKIANSIYEKNTSPVFFFGKTTVDLVKDWLKAFISECEE